MNINVLRKNYKNLNKIERNSLFISAVLRKDKSEETAITNASPQMLREMPDFTHLYSKVLSLQMIVIIHKADAFTNWLLFCEFETERADKLSRLALYYFFVYSDAWTAISKQLKIDSECISELMFPNQFILWRIAQIDDTFRDFAFTEDEARDFINSFTESETEIAMTLENKIAEFRDFLELPEK